MFGTPVHQMTRPLIVYKPTPKTNQSGAATADRWFIRPPRGEAWVSPVMEWQAGGDPMQQVKLTGFASQADAIAFCEHHGYDYMVRDDVPRRRVKRNYSDNFMYKPSKGQEEF
jgi:hypothetical protein